MRTNPFHIASNIVIGLVLLFEPPAVHAQRTDFIQYKFADLDEATRAKITEFNLQLAQFSEGCKRETDQATWSLLSRLASDGTCGLAVQTALKTKAIPAAAAAAIACGIQVPKAVRDHTAAKDTLRDCQAMESLRSKYKQYCEAKSRIVFAYQDVLYCYAAENNRELLLLEFDLKNRVVKIRKSGK